MTTSWLTRKSKIERTSLGAYFRGSPAEITRAQRVCCVLLAAVLQFAEVRAQSWTRVADIPGVSVNAVIEHGGILYAATDSAVYKSTDGGVSWGGTSQQPASTGLNTVFAQNGTLYVGTLGDGVFKSLDGGQTWQNISSGLTGAARRIAELAFRGDSLFAATDGDGIYLLNLSNPQTWIPHNSGLFQYGATSIITSGNTLVAGIGLYVFVRSRNASEWTHEVFDSSFSRNPIKLFRLGSFLFLGTSHGVFRATLVGSGWQRVDITQFPNREIGAFAAHGSRLFAGLRFGVEHWIWSTDDNGETWEIRAHEFAELLSLLVSHGRIWAGRTDGLWWYDIDVGTHVDARNTPIPTDFVLNQNYPNPFNPSTRISYTLQKTSHTTLKVYDVLGTELATLANEIQEAGSHQIEFDATRFSSGVYFYRLQSGSYTETKKMILIR